MIKIPPKFIIRIGVLLLAEVILILLIYNEQPVVRFQQAIQQVNNLRSREYTFNSVTDFNQQLSKLRGTRVIIKYLEATLGTQDYDSNPNNENGWLNYTAAIDYFAFANVTTNSRPFYTQYRAYVTIGVRPNSLSPLMIILWIALLVGLGILVRSIIVADPNLIIFKPEFLGQRLSVLFFVAVVEIGLAVIVKAQLDLSGVPPNILIPLTIFVWVTVSLGVIVLTRFVYSIIRKPTVANKPEKLKYGDAKMSGADADVSNSVDEVEPVQPSLAWKFSSLPIPDTNEILQLALSNRYMKIILAVFLLEVVLAIAINGVGGYSQIADARDKLDKLGIINFESKYKELEDIRASTGVRIVIVAQKGGQDFDTSPDTPLDDWVIYRYTEFEIRYISESSNYEVTYTAYLAIKSFANSFVAIFLWLLYLLIGVGFPLYLFWKKPYLVKASI